MDKKFKNGMDPVHPGEILLEDFLKPANKTYLDLLKGQVDEEMLNDAQFLLENIILQKISVSPWMAKVLAKCTGTSFEFWNNLQRSYDEKIGQL